MADLKSAFWWLPQDIPYEPETNLKLTPGGESLQKSLAESLKSLYPENLASRFIGQARKRTQAQMKDINNLVRGDTAPGANGVVSGANIGGLLTQSKLGLTGPLEGYRAAGQSRREYGLGQLGGMQNYMNLQRDVPLRNFEAMLQRGEMEQQLGADAGAMIGMIAQLATMGAGGGF